MLLECGGLKHNFMIDEPLVDYPKPKYRIALISDSGSHLSKAQVAARKFDIDVKYFSDVHELLSSNQLQLFDCIVLSLELGALRGIGIEASIRNTFKAIPTVLICSAREAKYFTASSDSMFKVIPSSFGFEKIFGEVDYAIKRNKFLKIQANCSNFEGLMGRYAS